MGGEEQVKIVEARAQEILMDARRATMDQNFRAAIMFFATYAELRKLADRMKAT